MKRYIYNIQYNKQDTEFDMVYVDAMSKKDALRKLGRQFPGVFQKHFVRIEKDLP